MVRDVVSGRKGHDLSVAVAHRLHCHPPGLAPAVRRDAGGSHRYACPGLPGVISTGYVSPTYGYELHWDSSWSVIDAASANGVDRLVLTNGTSHLVVSAATTFGGDPSLCLVGMSSALLTDATVGDVSLARDATGHPLQGADPTRAWAAYTYTQTAPGAPPVTLVSYYECRVLTPGVAVVGIHHVAPATAYATEAPAREALLEHLATGAAALVTPPGSEEALPAPPGVPQPPTQPATGPGGRAYHFPEVVSRRAGQGATSSWIFTPAQAAEPLPLVIFLHAHTLIDPLVYRAWIDHLVRRGAIVVYPDFQTGPDDDLTTYLSNTLGAVRGALEELKGEAVQPDLTRVAVIGHSVGAILGANYAATAAAAGLPEPAALLLIAPGGCTACPRSAWVGVELEDLAPVPATTRVLVVALAEVAAVGDEGARLIWAKLASVPLDRRDYVVLPGDAHGWPPLRAEHDQPLSFGTTVGPMLDALDWYGTWKLADALLTCSFAGTDCEEALGNTPEQRFLGVWSDGTPVAPAMITDDPPPPPGTPVAQTEATSP